MAKSSPTSTSDLDIYLRLLRYVKEHSLIFGLSIVGFILFALSQTALAHLMKYFVDGLEARDETYLLMVPLGMLGIVLVRGIGFFAGNYLMFKVSMSVVHRLRCQLFDHMVQAPKRFYDRTNTGQILSLLTYNVAQVTGAATEALKVLVREGFTVIGLLGYLFWMNWRASLVFLTILPIIALMVRYVGARMKRISRNIQDSMGDITHVANESIAGVQVVRAFGGEEYERERFLTASQVNLKQNLKLSRTSAAHTPLLQFILAIALAGLMYMVLRFFQGYTTGDVIAYITAAGLIPKPLRQISDVWSMIQKGVAAAETVFEALDGEREEESGSLEIPRVEGNIHIRHLNFTYPSAQRPALRDISMDIKAGEMIALVGHSGSGKTTLTSLLMRFYERDGGDILLDGQDIGAFKLASLRRQFSLVTQHVVLFNDSVRNNVAYGTAQNASDEAVWEALRHANAEDFVRAMPEGIRTVIGENGVTLSGGQKQRLAIARAILKDAPILLLDEATSALDSQSERLIQDALERISRQCTTLVIAHRLSTIQKADRIFVFDQGQIVESGTHQELLAAGGKYRSYYETQFSGQSVTALD